MIESIILIITLLVSIFLLRLVNGSASIRYLNGLNYIFYRQIIVSALIGSYVISLSMEYSRWYALNWSESIRLYGFIFVCYSSVAILFTYAILKSLFIDTKNLPKNLMVTSFSDNKINITLIQNLLFYISIFGFIYIIINSPSWPMLDVILGNNHEALYGRISFRNDFKGSEFIKNLVAFSGSALYFYISLSRKLIKSDGFLHLLLSTILVFLIYTYNSQKGAILNIVIGAIIILCMVRGKIPLRYFIFLSISSIVVLFSLFSIVKGIPISSLIESGGRLVIGRLFLGNIEGFFNSLALFPDIITDKTNLVGIPSIIQVAFFDEVQEPSKLLLMKFFDLDGIQNGTSGFITAYFLSEAWANYNIVGLIIAPSIVAVNLFIVDYIIYKKGKNILTLSFYAIMYLQFQLHGEFIGFLYFKYFFFFAITTLPIIIIYLTLKKIGVIKRI
ncbi:O-antigen polymerase [Providencia rettgeri]|uniref:O-antigen polymerase n=1 Tax=Providencia rettgeri TaxID=587 RepID=UPI0023616C13|nr:O-antigen polymerase [Providencia rettgeri]